MLNAWLFLHAEWKHRDTEAVGPGPRHLRVRLFVGVCARPLPDVIQLAAYAPAALIPHLQQQQAIRQVFQRNFQAVLPLGPALAQQLPALQIKQAQMARSSGYLLWQADCYAMAGGVGVEPQARPQEAPCRRGLGPKTAAAAQQAVIVQHIFVKAAQAPGPIYPASAGIGALVCLFRFH